MPYNLRHMTAQQALCLAKGVSGMNNAEISERAELGLSEISRFFSENDHYYPSLPKIPVLCRALGNPILREWITQQFQEMETDSPVFTPAGLSYRLLLALSNVGGLQKTVADAIADGKITRDEARSIQAHLHSLIAPLQELAAAIEPLAFGARQ